LRFPPLSGRATDSSQDGFGHCGRGSGNKRVKLPAVIPVLDEDEKIRQRIIRAEADGARSEVFLLRSSN
jgi:hypothetical protein